MARFDEIAKEKSNFHFKTSDVTSQMESEFTKNRESSSHLSEPKIYGRDEDVIKVVDMLLQTDHSSQEDILIIPIVGFGGVGKTTLAQLVYKHERIVGCFHIRIWVCVSDPFDVKRVLKQILDYFGGCNPESLDILQNKVLESLKHKKYLLVLDDVWSENEDAWNKLRSSLASGAKGSSIMVTTRIPRVASIANNASPPYNLGVLPDKDCWSLLKSRALGDNGEGQHSDLVPIGMEIAKKCKGIPLAAKSLGSLLKFRTKKSYWTHVRDHPIWKLENDEGNSILAALRLSYNHLPSRLKQCFSYCSIYPKDSYMYKTKLIYLWMANGFIQSQGRLELEEVGDDTFHELLRRSFFQDTQEYGYGNIQSFKMNDLMHDLACSFAANECSITEVGGVKDVPKSIRHLSVICDSKRPSTIIDPVIASESSLHTLVFFEPINFHSFKFSTTLRVLNLRDMGLATLPPSLCQLKYLRFLDLSENNLASLPESVCRLRYLQMLDLSDNNITTLPNSIGTLENLRYLSFSGCSGLTSIPESIGNVASLRYFDLSGCTSITVLPESMKGMNSLRYVFTTWCNSLKNMPLGLGELVYLQTLEWFVVGGEDSGCGGINELHGLNQIRGGLYIKGLENVRNAKEAKEANLIGKVFLEWLALKWENEVVREEIESKEVLECLLHLSPNLQWLMIDGYPGAGMTCFPRGLNNCLTELSITGCPNLKYLPEGMMQYLTSLRDLDLNDLPELVALPVMGIQGSNSTLVVFKINRCGSLKSLSEGLQYLTSLEKLEIVGCGELELEEEDCFQHLISLRELDIQNCENLTRLPQGIQHLTTLRSLSIKYCHAYLHTRCEENKGQHWNLIAHIPKIQNELD